MRVRFLLLAPKQKGYMDKKVTLEIIESNGNFCLSLNDYRIAGIKPYGGGMVVKKFLVSIKELKEALKDIVNIDEV
jgi:hypothetical protein